MSIRNHEAGATTRTPLWWPLLATFPILAAGVLKATPLAEAVPVDLTAAALAIIYGAASLRLLRRGWRVRGLWPLLGFTTLILIDRFRVPSGSYGEDKFGIYLVSAVGASVATAILVDSGRRLESFNLGWPLLAGMSIVLALPSLDSLGATTSGGFLDSAGRLYIGDATSGTSGGIGYVASMGLIWVVVTLTQERMRVSYALPMGAAFAFFAFGSASRGAALGLVAASLVGAALMGKHLRLILRLLFAATLAILILVLIIPDSVKSRLSLNDPIRLELWSAARSGFSAHPLIGNGLGSFADSFAPYRYPHNLFLEVAYEMGIVGLVALIAILVIAWRNIYSLREHYPVVVLGSVTAFLLAGSMVSSDMTNRYLWIPLTLCLAVPAVYGRRSKRIPQRNSPSRVSFESRQTPRTDVTRRPST